MKTPHESDKPPNRGRRDFLKVGGVSVAASLAYTAMPPGVNAESTDKTSILPAQAVQEMMPTRNLGKTGFRVGIFRPWRAGCAGESQQRSSRRADHREGTRTGSQLF